MGDKLLSQIPVMATPALTDFYYAISASGDVQGKVTAQQIVDLAQPYKKYVALLTQVGVAAPVVTVLENTLGVTVTWTRSGTGIYSGDVIGTDFTNLKTTVIMPNTSTGLVLAYSASTSNITVNTKAITTGTNTDGMLVQTTIEIRVYT